MASLQHTGSVPRYFYRLPGLTFERPWSLGAARFLPSSDLLSTLDTALTRQTAHASAAAAQQVVADLLLGEWANDAVLEVTCEGDAGVAERIAEEATSVLRFFLRRTVSLNADAHSVGMVGEVRGGHRQYLVLWEDDNGPGPLVAPGFRNVGGTVPFHFTANVLNGWDDEPAVQLLGRSLSLSAADRPPSERKALDALSLLDAGRRSLEPTTRLLCGSVAVEALFTAPKAPPNDKLSQTADIARRFAYLTCFAGCGRSEGHCYYTETSKSYKEIFRDMKGLAEQGQEWRCSAYLDIAAPPEALAALDRPPLFVARNLVAHRGSTAALSEAHLTRLAWVIDQAIYAGLDWYGRHPGKDANDLDAQINTPLSLQPEDGTAAVQGRPEN